MDAETIYQRRWLTLGVLCLSLLLIVMDNSIVNVALPTIQRDLDASTSDLQWVVDSYVLVFAGLLLTAGALGDRFGRKGALTAGLVIMAASAALSALATTTTQLIASRAVMGIGGALIMPATLSIVTNVFSDPKERGRAIAVWAGAAGIAAVLGPVTGGWLLEHFWWGSVFLVNIPVIVLALVAGRFLVPTSKDPAAARLDPPGAVLSILGLSTLVWAIISAGEDGWGSGAVLTAFGVSAALVAAFILWERATAHPMLDTTVFRNPRFSGASTAIMLTFFAMFGTIFAVTQYLQFILGYTALETGVRMLPWAAVMMVVAPTSARIVERVGSKAVVGTGLFVLAAGLAWWSTLTVDASYGEVAWRFVVLGIGMGLIMPPATESIMGSLPPAKAGVGSAVNDTTRQVGGALGVAVLGSLLASTYSSRVGDAIAGVPLPEGAADAVTDQLGAAMAVAGRIGGAAGEALSGAASQAFVDGMSIAMLVAAGVALVGSVLVFLFLPARAREAARVPADDAADDAVDVERPTLQVEPVDT